MKRFGETSPVLGLLILAMGLVACEVPAPRYQFGENVTGLAFHLYDANEGVHPSTSILDDPNNLFATSGVGEETKWDVLSSGGDVAAFYAWGTILARGPWGEPQFYTAKKLADLYESGQVADPDDLPTVRDMAVRGFQSVLDNFPADVTKDATGTTSYRLATLAYRGILDLGGEPLGGWALVTTPSGGEEAVLGGKNP